MMLKKSFSIMLASIVLTSAYSAAQTTPVPTKQLTPSYFSRLRNMAKKAKNEVLTFAKGANDTAHWHTTMETVKQSNPGLYERIKTEKPLFFDWATHSRWQRRWKNLLHVVGPTTIAGLLFGAMHTTSMLKKHPLAFSKNGPLAPFSYKEMTSDCKAVSFSLIHPFFGLYWGVIGFIAASYFSQDAPLYVKDVLKPILAILATTAAGDFIGMKASQNASPVDCDYKQRREYVANPRLWNDSLSFEARSFGALTGGAIGLIGTLILLRKRMLARHQELKEQEAQVTQWLTAEGITLNKGANNDA